MRIVSQCDSQSKTVTKHGSQRHNTLPRHIGCVLNTARHKVTARRTHTHRAYFVIASVLLHQHDDPLTQRSDKIRDIRIVHRIKIVCRDNLTTYIHHSIGGFHFTNVDTNNPRLDLIY